MGLNFRQYPFVLQGILWLGASRVLEIATLAGVSIKGMPKVPGAIAGALLKQINSPAELRSHLTAADLDIIGSKYGVGSRATWKMKEPGFDAAVLARLFEERELPTLPPKTPSARDASRAGQWPELSTFEAWAGLDNSKRSKVAKTLARAMGERFMLTDLLGPNRLAHFQDDLLKLAFVAIPGGHFSMGLSDAEKKALTRLAKNWSEEAKMHVRDLADVARPAHPVTLPPFLCAVAPMTRAQGRKYTKNAQVFEAGHKVCLYDAASAVALTRQSGTRLLTEAEWEYIARAGGGLAWLSGEENPKIYAARVQSAKLQADDGHPFGISGLGWGSWVEDSWHPSFRGAPADGSAWEPLELPNAARGGAFLSWPWQVDGEALLLHAAQRERIQDRSFPLLVARDLPARRAK